MTNQRKALEGIADVTVKSAGDVNVFSATTSQPNLMSEDATDVLNEKTEGN